MCTGSSNCLVRVKIVESTLSIYQFSSMPKTVRKSRGRGPRTPVTCRSLRVASLNSPPVPSTSEAPTTELLNPSGTFSLSSLSLDQFLAAIRLEVRQELDSRTPQPSPKEQGASSLGMPFELIVGGLGDSKQCLQLTKALFLQIPKFVQCLQVQGYVPKPILKPLSLGTYPCTWRHCTMAASSLCCVCTPHHLSAALLRAPFGSVQGCGGALGTNKYMYRGRLCLCPYI